MNPDAADPVAGFEVFVVASTAAGGSLDDRRYHVPHRDDPGLPACRTNEGKSHWHRKAPDAVERMRVSLCERCAQLDWVPEHALREAYDSIDEDARRLDQLASVNVDHLTEADFEHAARTSSTYYEASTKLRGVNRENTRQILQGLGLAGEISTADARGGLPNDADRDDQGRFVSPASGGGQ